MKIFQLRIECDNTAFEEDSGAEAARILRLAAEQIELYVEASALFDANGNRVGEFSMQEEGEPDPPEAPVWFSASEAAAWQQGWSAGRAP